MEGQLGENAPSATPESQPQPSLRQSQNKHARLLLTKGKPSHHHTNVTQASAPCFLGTFTVNSHSAEVHALKTQWTKALKRNPLTHALRLDTLGPVAPWLPVFLFGRAKIHIQRPDTSSDRELQETPKTLRNLKNIEAILKGSRPARLTLLPCKLFWN